MTPPSETDRLQATTHSPSETQHLGTRLARGLIPGDLVCLQGDLGSGKTCLTQGIARGLGVAGAVASPTFIIINEYRIPGEARRLRHIDLYRVESIAAFESKTCQRWGVTSRGMIAIRPQGPPGLTVEAASRAK